MIFVKVLLVAFLAVFIQVEANPEMIMKIVKECKEKVGPTDADVAHLMHLKQAENQVQKCMLSCLFSSINIVS